MASESRVVRIGDYPDQLREAYFQRNYLLPRSSVNQSLSRTIIYGSLTAILKKHDNLLVDEGDQIGKFTAEPTEKCRGLVAWRLQVPGWRSPIRRSSS